MERIAAATQLCRLFGLFIEKHVFTGATLEQLLAAAEEQEKKQAPTLRLINGGAQ